MQCRCFFWLEGSVRPSLTFIFLTFLRDQLRLVSVSFVFYAVQQRYNAKETFFSGQNTNTNKTLRTHASTIQRVGFTNNSPFLVICIYYCGEDAPFDLSGGRSMVLTIFGISWSLTGALLSLPGVGFILAVDFAKTLISSVHCAFG